MSTLITLSLVTLAIAALALGAVGFVTGFVIACLRVARATGLPLMMVIQRGGGSGEER